MTNTRRGSCTGCHLRPIDNSVCGPELCTVCLEYADIEIMHWDNGADDAHDAMGLTVDTCPVCNPDADRRYTKKAGHTNTANTGVRRSHDGCNHPRTPRDRAACRKAGGPKVPNTCPVHGPTGHPRIPGCPTC